MYTLETAVVLDNEMEQGLEELKGGGRYVRRDVIDEMIKDIESRKCGFY